MEKIKKKKKKIVHVIGDRYIESISGREYILARVSKEEFCLVSVLSGERWNDAVTINIEGTSLTKSQFAKLDRLGEFRKIPAKKSEPLIKLFLVNKHGLFLIGEVEDTAFAREAAVTSYFKDANTINNEFYVFDETIAQDWIDFLEDELN